MVPEGVVGSDSIWLEGRWGGMPGMTGGISGVTSSQKGVFLQHGRIGIVTNTHGSCFGADWIVDTITARSFMGVLSVGEAGVGSKQVYPFGNGGMAWPLVVEVSGHPDRLGIVLAAPRPVRSKTVALHVSVFDSRNSTGHSSGLCESLPAAHAEENAG